MSDSIIEHYRGSFLMPSLEHATVGDVMHPGIVSCDVDTALSEVARLMATHHVHCIAVTRPSYDRSEEPYVWGIVSDLDLMQSGITQGAEGTAAAIAQQPTITVKTTVPLRDAADLMLKHGASHLVVIHPNTLRPVGVLSTLDIVGTIAWGEA